MTLQFNISGLALTVAEGGSYSFTLTPKGQLSAAMDIRWVIVPKGKVPITKNDFSALEGTESFASGATAGKTITITPTDDALAEVSGEFEIQIYQVVSGGDILIGSQDVTLTDDDTASAVLLNALPGNSNVNNLFLGGSVPFVSEGGSGNDAYVISRYQSGDVDLTDGFQLNTIKFDYGVEIVSVVRTGFLGSGPAAVTLGTGGVVAWSNPTTATNWQYQIGDGNSLSWAEFLTALGLGSGGGTLSTPFTVDSLASDTITGGNIASGLSGANLDDVLSFGGDGYFASEGGSGDDTYIITRYQSGDVDLTDGFQLNTIKFDYGVEIAAVVRTGFLGSGPAAVTLGTGGVVAWSNPTTATNWRYQLADGAVLSWTEFLTALGLGSSGGTLSTPYTVEDPPGKIITSDATGAALPENTAVATSTAVYTAAGASDAGAIVWSLKTGADAGLFNINSSTGAVTFINATTPDHEDKSNYSFTIVATVGTSATAETDELLVTIAVTDLNDTSPVFTSATAATLVEGTAFSTTTAVYTATGTPDVAGDTIVWSLSGGGDAGLFNINSSTGAITFRNATTIDYESGQTSYRFNVIATVGTGNTAQTATQAVTLSVPNVNEAPIISTNAGAAISLNVLEGTTTQTPIAKIVASDGDGDSLSYSLSGADAADFTIDANGVLKFAASPSRATPADSDTDNVYNITVTVSDGTLSDTIALTISVVTASGATAPTISSGATGTFAENTLFDTDTPIYTATGSAGSLISWSLKAGGDAALFDIDPLTGEVTFKAATTPDFEADPSYSFTIVATTGTHNTEQAVTITITDAEDPPVLAGDLSGDVKEAGLIAVVSSEKKVFEAHGIVFTLKDNVDDDTISIIESLEYFQFVQTYPHTLIVATENSDSNNLWVIFHANFALTYDKLLSELSDSYSSALVNSFDYSFADGIVGTTGLSTTGYLARIPFALSTISAGLVPTPSAGVATATGQLSVTDEDTDDADGFGSVDLQVRVDSDSAWTTANTDAANGGKGLKIVGTYGALYIKSDGSWSYELDNDAAATQALTPDDAVPETFELRVTDGSDPSETKILTITVEGTNDSALSASASGVTTTNGVGAISVAEDTQTGNVTTITVSNPDGTPLVYSLLGADRNLFTFDAPTGNAGTGVLRFKEIPDFEFPTDVGKNNVYNVTVHIDDGVFSEDIVLAVTVTDVISTATPTITSSPTGSIKENLHYGTKDFIYVADGTSGSHERIVWSLKPANSDNAALFDINPRTGWVTFKAATTLDYESSTFIGSTAADGTREFKFTIVATVGSGGAEKQVSKNIIIKLEDLNDAPEITTNSGNAIALSVAENSPSTTILTTITEDDDDVATAVFRYSLSGADADDFIINAQGQLQFKTAPDADAPTDSNTDNIYDVTITVQDDIDASGSGLDSDSRRFSYDGGVATITDSDAVGNTPAARTLGVTSGSIIKSDGTIYSFAAQTGLNVTADSYIIVDDLNNDNSYEVRLVSKASGLPSGNDFYVLGEVEPHTVQGASFASVTVADAIIISSTIIGPDGNGAVFEMFYNGDAINTKVSISEDSVTGKITLSCDNNATLQTLITAIDTHALTAGRFTAEIVAGVSVSTKIKDIAGFSIQSSSGDLILTGGSNTRSGALTINPTLSDSIDVTVTVTNLYDSPPIISSGNGTIVENVLFTTASPVYTATGTADVGTTIAWSLKAGGDSGLFGIDSGTGVVTFNSATTPDYESGKTSYSFTIIATTGSGATLRTTEKAVTISVIDVNDAPIITDTEGANDGRVGVAVLEAAPSISTNFYTVVASDAEGDTLSYSLSGADAALFTINASGQLSFISAPDFEAPADADGDNVYNITVTVSDGTGAGARSDTIDITVGVTNRHDSGPIITSDATGSVLENKLFTTSTPVYTATGTPDIATYPITWSLKSGGDASSFNINATTGVVTFARETTPNYEVGGHSYSFTIIATAGPTGQKFSTEKAITINKIDSFDIPFFTTNNGVSPYNIDLAENSKIVTRFSAHDNEGDTLSYRVSGADAALFEIDSSGVLRFKSGPDFETPADVGGDNTYDVTVHVGGREYDATGNPNDADTRTFKYTGGITSIMPSGGGNNMTVRTAGGTITTEDGTTITFYKAGTGTGVLQAAAPSYIIISRANTAAPYRVKLAETLPAGDDFYVLGWTEAKTVSLPGGGTRAGESIIYDPLASTIDVEVTITNVADNAPRFNASTSTILQSVVSGNSKGGLRLRVEDADGPGIDLTYSLLGEDRFDFIISHTSNTEARVTLRDLPDKASPTDANGDNSYRAILRVQENGAYDASGDQNDADTRVFDYTGGALTSSNHGLARKVNVAAGTITEGNTTISFDAVTGLTISGTAQHYILVDDADDDGTYEVRQAAALPDSDDFYVLGRAEAAAIPLTKASGTFGGIVFTAINPGNAGNYSIKFFASNKFADVVFNGNPGGEIQIDINPGHTTLQHIINAINAPYGDTIDYVVATVAEGANAQSVFSYTSGGNQSHGGTLSGFGTMTGGTQRGGEYFVNDVPLHDDIAIQIDVM